MPTALATSMDTRHYEAPQRDTRERWSPSEQVSVSAAHTSVSQEGPQSASLMESEQELLHCENEITALLNVIAELNAKVGGLSGSRANACDEPAEMGAPSIPMRESQTVGSKQCLLQARASLESSRASPDAKEGSAGSWLELQHVMTDLENSIRTWRAEAASTTAQDAERTHKNLKAAQECWTHATQVLEELERDLGIVSASGLNSEESSRYEKDVTLYRCKNQELRAALACKEEELKKSKVSLSSLEQERVRFLKKVLDLQSSLQVRSSGSSPPLSPSSSSSEVSSSCWASPPHTSSPGPAIGKLCSSPLGDSGGDTPGSPPALTRAQMSPQALMAGGFESETERLQRCIERLKARNDRLSAALDRRKGEAEQISMVLDQHESRHTALQLALKSSEACEQMFRELLEMYETRNVDLVSTQVTGEPNGRGKSPEMEKSLREPLEGSEGAMHKRIHGAPPTGREVALRAHIQQLKQERAAMKIPILEASAEGRPTPDTDTLPGPRPLHALDTPSPKREKATLLQELVGVREEMAELRSEIKLAEKERRYLEWCLSVQKAQEVATALILECRRSEEEEEEEKDGAKSSADWVTTGEAALAFRNHPVMRQIQAAQQREQTLKKRTQALRSSLEAVMAESSARGRRTGELTRELTRAHSSVATAYKGARRKYQEQLWLLDRQMVAMKERHSMQISGLKNELRELENKRAETTL
ncbi:colorectal mutant cancer protein isoform X2 [Polypterus senegalus]|uniref:colorectal mutant cancer protein isoform X2 n=1 Tax=Polypterus senegalus TaxID=55291 RepID=UPI0019660333|nr:colorectal mutant cancer protein isoform X2 [Polypterus senegalus]